MGLREYEAPPPLQVVKILINMSALNEAGSPTNSLNPFVCILLKLPGKKNRKNNKKYKWPAERAVRSGRNGSDLSC